MLKNKLRRVCSIALALSACAVCATTFTACESSKPEVEIQIEFNGKTYTLDYVLYRKIAPATVNHFIALAENGYYDGLCVHDYDDDRLLTGAYSYDGENLVYKKYYDVVKNYDNFPHSVWTSSDKKTSTYTLYGEFYANADFTVESGALRQTYGSLTMYYTKKNTEDKVTIERHNGEGTALREYKYNSATSQFFITLDDDQSADDNYCTFATLEDDDWDTLASLQRAVLKYIENEYAGEEDDFAPEVTLDIDTDDAYAANTEATATYDVPKKPIVIKKVTVTKY